MSRLALVFLAIIIGCGPKLAPPHKRQTVFVGERVEVATTPMDSKWSRRHSGNVSFAGRRQDGYAILTVYGHRRAHNEYYPVGSAFVCMMGRFGPRASFRIVSVSPTKLTVELLSWAESLVSQ